MIPLFVPSQTSHKSNPFKVIKTALWPIRIVLHEQHNMDLLQTERVRRTGHTNQLLLSFIGLAYVHIELLEYCTSNNVLLYQVS